MSNPQHHTQHHTEPKIDSESPAVGSEAWYAQRWRAQWAALGEAFAETEAQIQKYKEKLDEPTPLAKGEKEQLCGALRLILNPPAGGAGLEVMKAMGIFVNSPLVIQETQQPKATDDVLQQYYIPATVKKQVMLLEKLRVFAETVFPFFYHGFYPNQQPLAPWHVQEKLAKIADGLNGAQPTFTQVANALFFASAQYSPNFVLGRVLEQISLDLSIIHQAFQQRQMLTLRAKLSVADNFARLALKPAIESDFFGDNAVLSYLNKVIDIRLLPYQELILIGIPFTANVKVNPKLNLDLDNPFFEASHTAAVSTDYLAIPHEIGHCLYQYGQAPASDEHGQRGEPVKRPLAKIVQGQLQEELAKQSGRLEKSAWIYGWLEEIFADAYGCLVAGPVSVLGFLQVLADGLPSDQQQQSAKHPIPALRPLIQTQILRTIMDQFGNHLYEDEADQLDAQWRQWVKEHWSQWVDKQWPYGFGNQTDILRAATYKITGQGIIGREMTGQEILEELQTAIDVILSILNRLRPQSMASTWTPHWEAKSYPTGQKITGLFEHFKYFAVVEWYLSFAEILPVAEPIADQITDNQTGVLSQLSWLSKQLDRLQRERFIKPGFDMLVETLLFEGWSTEGPTGGGIPPK